MRKTKHYAKWPVTGLLSTAMAGFIGHAQLPIVSVDMIPGNGVGVIDPVINVAAGTPITVDLLLWAGAAGVQAYAVSAQVDNTELTWTGDTEPLPAPFFGHMTVGSAGWANIGPGVDQISTFESNMGLPPGAGPVNGPWLTIGTISFTVGTPLNDGLPDVIPGFFVGGMDSMFSNGGVALVPTFNPGFVIPEPGVISGAALLWGFAGVYGCRRRR